MQHLMLQFINFLLFQTNVLIFEKKGNHILVKATLDKYTQKWKIIPWQMQTIITDLMPKILLMRQKLGEADMVE